MQSSGPDVMDSKQQAYFLKRARLKVLVLVEVKVSWYAKPGEELRR